VADLYYNIINALRKILKYLRGGKAIQIPFI